MTCFQILIVWRSHRLWHWPAVDGDGDVFYGCLVMTRIQKTRILATSCFKPKRGGDALVVVCWVMHGEVILELPGSSGGRFSTIT